MVRPVSIFFLIYFPSGDINAIKCMAVTDGSLALFNIKLKSTTSHSREMFKCTICSTLFYPAEVSVTQFYTIAPLLLLEKNGLTNDTSNDGIAL